MINEQLKKDKNYQKLVGNKQKKTFNVGTKNGINKLHNFAKVFA